MSVMTAEERKAAVKVCTKCDEAKVLGEFYNDRSKRDGKASRCKSCVKAYDQTPGVKAKNKSLRQSPENREKRAVSCRRYLERNREKVLEASRRRYRENSEKRRADARKYAAGNVENKAAYRVANREKLEESRRKYIAENAENRAETSRRWRAANGEKIAAQAAVLRAVRKGELSRPDECSNCRGSRGVIEGHHWSYLPEHWLDVVWLCAGCHCREHARLDRGELPMARVVSR